MAAAAAAEANDEPDVMMRDRAETEADLGTRLPGEVLGFSIPSFWLLSRRLLPGSKPLGAEFLVPVLLLRRRMRFRLTRSAEREEEGGGKMAVEGRFGPSTGFRRAWRSHPTPLGTLSAPKTHAPDNAEVFTAVLAPVSGSPSTNLGRSGLAGATQGLSSSEEKANLGMVSRL